MAGVEAIRHVRRKCRWVVLNAHSVVPGSDSEVDKAAAERAFDFHNGAFFDPVFKGHYPESLIAALGEKMPVVEEEIWQSSAQKLDWWGLNYYTPMRVADDASRGAEFPATSPHRSSSLIKPISVGRSTRLPWAIWSLISTSDTTLPDMYITENGACYNMGVVNGEVDDQPRMITTPSISR